MSKNFFSNNGNKIHEQKPRRSLHSFLSEIPQNQTAQLDLLTIETSKFFINDPDNKSAPLAWRVLQHPDLLNKYNGARGLFLYAKTYFNGDIQLARQTVATYLPKEFQQLQWEKYRDQIQILNIAYQWQTFMAGGRVFRGMEGYGLIANLYFEGNMAKAFDDTLIMSGLSAEQFIKRFGWKRFEGYTDRFYLLRRKITNLQGWIVNKYRYKNGLKALASQFDGGDISKIYLDIKSVLNFVEFKYLSWPED